MSFNEKRKPVNPDAQNPAGQQGQPQFFPPPPPGPPPVQTTQAQVPKHPDETPLPDYNIPAYNPTHPQFAPPPAAGDDDIYGATPTDAHPPKFPPTAGQPADHHEKVEEGSKKKSNKFAAFGAAFSSKVTGPVNALAHKFGSEGFLPESLDKECEKAARILKGFCKDGIYSDVVPPTTPSAAPVPVPTTADTKPPADPSKTKKPSRVLLTIPSKVIARAQGLAIFTSVRVGFQATGSSGSGILIARQANGSWSPPSGIHVTSIGAGFVAGLDIYDCVIVINTREALDLFTKTRLSLGSDLAVTAGPFGAGGALEWGVPPGEKKEDKKKDGLKPGAPAPPPPLSADNTKFQTKPVSEEDQLEEDDRPNRKPSPFREAIKKPVYSYVKSRGLFAGVQIDGTVVAEREGANAKFYGQAVPVAKILKGEVPVQGPPGMWPAAAKGLFDVLKGAEGWRGPGQQGPGQQGSGQQGPGQQGPGQQGPPPVSPGLVNPTAFGAGSAAGVGAPPTTWIPPPAPAPAPGPGVTTGMQNLGIRDGASAAGPSTIPPGPPPQPTAAASAKAAEAAAEAAHQQPPAQQPPPPSYSEFHHGAAEDLPPAYAEDDRSRLPTGDGKTGLH